MLTAERAGERAPAQRPSTLRSDFAPSYPWRDMPTVDPLFPSKIRRARLPGHIEVAIVLKRAGHLLAYLMAPNVRPLTRCRCTKRMKMKIGTIEATPSAARYPHSVAKAVVKVDEATGTVRIVPVVRT